MRSPPADVDEVAVVAALAEVWGFDAVDLRFHPVGFGSQHWLATDAAGERRFVTLDNRDADRLETAFTVAAGIDAPYVAPPFAPVLHRLDSRWAMALFPFLEGVDVTVQELATDEHRRAAIDIVVDLHTRDGTGAPAVDLTIPRRDGLLAALDDLATPWDSGPQAADAQALLAGHAGDVERWLDRYDRLATITGAAPRVLTHGEPHGGNVVRARDGWYLVDWDTVAMAPPERDVWHVPGGVAAYEAATGRRLVPDVLETFVRWWDLSEVAQYATELRAEHTGTADDEERIDQMRHYVGRLAG